MKGNDTTKKYTFSFARMHTHLHEDNHLHVYAFATWLKVVLNLKKFQIV